MVGKTRPGGEGDAGGRRGRGLAPGCPAPRWSLSGAGAGPGRAGAGASEVGGLRGSCRPLPSAQGEGSPGGAPGGPCRLRNTDGYGEGGPKSALNQRSRWFWCRQEMSTVPCGGSELGATLAGSRFRQGAGAWRVNGSGRRACGEANSSRGCVAPEPGAQNRQVGALSVNAPIIQMGRWRPGPSPWLPQLHRGAPQVCAYGLCDLEQVLALLGPPYPPARGAGWGNFLRWDDSWPLSRRHPTLGKRRDSPTGSAGRGSRAVLLGSRLPGAPGLLPAHTFPGWGPGGGLEQTPLPQI